MGIPSRLLVLGFALCCSLGLTSPPALAAGSNLFVDESSLGGPCSDSYTVPQVTPAKPWCTLTEAFQAAPAGSTVYIRSGTYPFAQLHGTYGQPARLTSYVTFEPYGYGTSTPEAVTIDGVDLANTAYLRFQGLRFVGNDATSDVSGVSIGANTHDVQVLDSEVTGQGIEDAGASNVLIQGDYVHDTTYNCSIKTQLDGAGIYLTGGSFSNPPIDNVQVLDNRVENNGQDAIDIGNATNVVVQGNDVSTGLTPPSYAACGYHVDEIQMENGGLGPVTIVDNTFHDGTQFTLRNASGLMIENNLILRIDNWLYLMADPGARVINNTIWGGNQLNTGAGSILLEGYAAGSSWTQPPFNYANTAAGTIIENNIFRLLGVDQYVTADQYVESHNVIIGPPQNNSGLHDPGTNDVFGAPAFVAAGSGDFHLADGSLGVGLADPAVAPEADMLGTPWAGNVGALQTPTVSNSSTPPSSGGPPPAGPSEQPEILQTAVPGGIIPSRRSALFLTATPSPGSSVHRVIKLIVGCSRACRITVSGTIAVGRTRRAAKAHILRLRPVTASVAQLRARSIVLRIPPRFRGALHGAVSVTLHVVAWPSDGSSVKTTVRERVRI